MRGIQPGTSPVGAVLAGDVSSTTAATDREGDRPETDCRADARLPGIPEEIAMFSRRVFLKNGGLALLSLGFAPAFLARTVEAAGAARRKMLITIFQRGAVDGLNMIVPFGERDYYASRPSIAMPKPNGEPRARSISTASSACTRAWRRSSRCGTRASSRSSTPRGSPDTTRSHFDAQDYMETATPGVKSTQDGWLNRYLHAKEHAEATPVPRRRARAADAALAAGARAGARHRADRPVRHPRRPGDRHGAGVVRIRVRRGRRPGPEQDRRTGVRRGAAC